VKIGIFGGTFDPVHEGHLALARTAVREIRLDRLFFVPNRRSPLKSRAPVSEAPHRLNLLRLASKKVPRSRISLAELNRPGASYTVGTVRRFRSEYPGSRLFLVMGSDSLRGFKRWKSWRKILELCTLVVGKRKGSKAFPVKLGKKVLFLKSSMPGISSSRMRTALEAGKNLHRLVPPSVKDYIERHGLYGTTRPH
jgi:nicotinate-nucleotide adenylyltransferase